MGVKEKALTVASSIASGDFLRMVTSAGAARKIEYSKLAKAIVEEYNGSTIAGSAQTLKAALDSLNSKQQKYVGLSVTSGLVEIPITGMTANSSVICSIERTNATSVTLLAFPEPVDNKVYVYIRTNNGSVPPAGTTVTISVSWR